MCVCELEITLQEDSQFDSRRSPELEHLAEYSRLGGREVDRLSGVVLQVEQLHVLFAEWRLEVHELPLSPPNERAAGVIEGGDVSLVVDAVRPALEKREHALPEHRLHRSVSRVFGTAISRKVGARSITPTESMEEM